MFAISVSRVWWLITGLSVSIDISGIFLDSFKEREQMKHHFQKTVTYMKKRNAYGMEISILCFIENLDSEKSVAIYFGPQHTRLL